MWLLGTRLARIDSARHPKPRVVFTTMSELFHGSAVRVPSSAYRVSIAVNSRWLLDSAVDLITREPTMPGLQGAAKELHGRPRQLTVLAHALSAKVSSDTLTAVTSVSVVGMSLQSRTRTFLQKTFPSAEITEIYSLSEIISGACRCGSCGQFHMDAPVIAEVVDLTSKKPKTAGPGMLVLTELYPFSQLQPFIRYETGDIVRACPSACGPGIAFEFLGRQDQTPSAVLEGHLEVILTPRVFWEVLEDIPEVARSPAGAGSCPPYDVLPLGFPYATAKTTSRSGKASLEFDIGVTFSPDLYPERANDLCQQIVDSLQSKDPQFNAAIRCGVVPYVKLHTCDKFPLDMSKGK